MCPLTNTCICVTVTPVTPVRFLPGPSGHSGICRSVILILLSCLPWELWVGYSVPGIFSQRGGSDSQHVTFVRNFASCSSPFYGFTTVCCTFSCWWPPGFSPVFGCWEYSSTRLCVDMCFIFSWVNSLEWGCQVTGSVYMCLDFCIWGECRRRVRSQDEQILVQNRYTGNKYLVSIYFSN